MANQVPINNISKPNILCMTEESDNFVNIEIEKDNISEAILYKKFYITNYVPAKSIVNKINKSSRDFAIWCMGFDAVE